MNFAVATFFFFFSKFWISTCFFNGKLLLLFSTFNNVKTIIYLKWNIHMCLFELCCRNQSFYFFSKHAFNLSLFCISSFANFPLQCKCRFWLNSAWVPSSQLQCNAVVGKILSPKPEFVKEWVVDSQKILFTFADISHISWCYVKPHYSKKQCIQV